MHTDLRHSACQPYKKGDKALAHDESKRLLDELKGWHIASDGKRLVRELVVDNFQTGLALFRKVGEIAEAEDHHPDLHLEKYQNVRIELWTHTVGGLSMNDFIVAAKIDAISVL